MPDTIHEFMWSYQRAFRVSASHLAELTLDRIGVHAAPEVLLVGFATDDATTPRICVEPEYGPSPSSSFADVMAKADETFADRDDLHSFTTEPNLQRDRLAATLENHRRRQIEAALQAVDENRGRLFFAGVPATIGSYLVYPVVSVLTGLWSSYAQTSAPIPQRQGALSASWGLPRSLQEAVVRRVLREMTLGMSMSDDPQDLRDSADSVSRQIIRASADDLVRGLVYASGYEFGSDLVNAMVAVAAQPYEGRTGIGTLIVSREDHPRVSQPIRFEDPIPLRRTRAFRKALEMTGPALQLLTDGTRALGLGHYTPAEQTAAPDLLVVSVSGRGQWELADEQGPLLSMDNGDATLPRERLSKDKFVDTVGRLFGHGDDVNAETLWTLSQAAARQQHGTMLVVHRDAPSEAKRLAPQALSIAPIELTDTDLESVTAIDGAIMADPQGRCHAVGVILDGHAVTGLGDAARGARYNSAVRYQQAAEEGSCLIVIVSEDGMINVLPDLRRRVKASAVEDAVAALERESTEPVHFEIAMKAFDHVAALSFYLDQAQSERANQARADIEKARWRGGTFFEVGYVKFAPDDAMSADYLIPEDPTPGR